MLAPIGGFFIEDPETPDSCDKLNNCRTEYQPGLENRVMNE